MATWSSGLFDCIDDTNSCMYSFVCTPCALASAKSHVDGSYWFFNCLISSLIPCIASPAYRHSIRTSYGIKGSVTEDCVSGAFCSCCSTGQLLREAQARGPSTYSMF
ncbi:hypothetical protein C9374_009489 [Naegleria lovaniensis]|uniref:PLAC8 family protein n=1 Tax=Naegleria lovaniensis TaxID=51637 RepID=A0AA88H4Q8_NAELO|nr:uncharacterized protein C9374_009489 [Naegleria lovaniensis]KAG2392912.1 hypothetical protein C9374_009489 [Naegleria lovaniensis]